MKLEIKRLDSEDVTRSRKEVDRVYEIFREGVSFTKSASREVPKNASRRIPKATVSRKSS